MNQPALAIANLEVDYETGAHAVRGVSLTVAAGTCSAIVGESGSGKSTVLSAILGMLPRNASMRGTIAIAGERVDALRERDFRRLRGRSVALVPQSPFEALEPLRSVQHHVRAAARAHGLRLSHADVAERLHALGIPAEQAQRRARPHEWSGGMLQRACIAAALVHRPGLVLADEPTSALDAEVADQVMATIRAHSPTLLFVTHNLAVAARVADVIHVMYSGRIIESRPAAELIRAPRHPYTRALLAASDPAGGLAATELAGDPPPALVEGTGCLFRFRCPDVTEACATVTPDLTDGVACLCSEVVPS